MINRLTARCRRIAQRASDRPGAAIWAMGGAMLAAYLAAMVLLPRGGDIVAGDAKHHFVQLRSVVFDGDLDFRNEYTSEYGVRLEDPEADWLSSDLTATGLVRNYMPVGPAILWAPLYLLAAGAQLALAWAGLASRPDGFEPALQLMPGVTGILAATMATWLSFQLARRWSSLGTALLAAAGVWLGSHALYYTLVSPAYSHAASMLTSAAFFSYWARTRTAPTTGRVAAWGALAGACALMRWQDAIFLLVPACELLAWRVTWRQRLTAGVAGLAAWLAVFSPQMMVWQVLYGQAFTVPQGPSFLQWTAPHPLAILFSDNHGLFTWAPLLACAVIGLAALLGRQPTLRLPVGLVVLGSWYVSAAVVDWWAGEAFGARRLLSLYPWFVVGLAVWLQPLGHSRIPPWRLAALGALTMANWLLLLQYQLFMRGLEPIAPYPHGWYDMWVVRFLVPIRLMARWLD